MSTVACSERDQIMRSRGKCSASSASRAPSELPLMSSASSDGDCGKAHMIGRYLKSYQSTLQALCDLRSC